MAAHSPEWDERLAALWASIDDLPEEEFLARIDRLAAELPADSAVAVFERAASFDSTGHSDLLRAADRRQPILLTAAVPVCRQMEHPIAGRVPQSTDSRSTTKTSGSCGLITPPAPRAP